MELRKIGLFLFNELILIIVFLNGIWIRLGIYPEEETWKPVFLSLYNLLQNSYLFWLMPFLLLFPSMLGSYFIGGWLGLIAISLAFLSGYFLNSSFSMILLLIGIILGSFAPLRD
jgi:hypothetical protein